MKKQIKRKFLVKKMPNLEWITPVLYERYFLLRNDIMDIRVQKKWDKYQFERKEEESKLCARKRIFDISEDEFIRLKKSSNEEIIRTSYKVHKNPKTTIKIYDSRFEGLIRVEVGFDNEKSAEKYQAPDWFWKEITATTLAKDSKLMDLSEKEFKKLIK